MKRNITLDILRGILIYLVVLGHTPSLPSPVIGILIFSFHMPAFIILSGIHLRDIADLRSEAVRKAKRLLVPYAFFSLALGCVYGDRGFFKQVIGTIIGGNGNITVCTYPYYFITMLFFAIMLFYLIRCACVRYGIVRKIEWGGVIMIYIIGCLLSSIIGEQYIGWVPWSFDLALVACIYLYVGKYAYKFIDSAWVRTAGVIAALLFASVCLACPSFYHYNLKSHQFVPFADVVVPACFLVALYVLSELLGKVGWLSRVLSFTGRASMCVLLLHPFFAYTNREMLGIGNAFANSLLTTAQCVACYFIFCKNKYTRILIGEKPIIHARD